MHMLVGSDLFCLISTLFNSHILLRNLIQNNNANVWCILMSNVQVNAV